MTRPRLRSVEPSAECRLRMLFKREDELLAELAQVRGEQRETRLEYAQRQDGRLLILPSMETLRRTMG